MDFPGLLKKKTWGFQGQLQKKKFPGVFTKNSCGIGARRSSEKCLVWIIQPSTPKIFFKFPRIFGATERNFLKFQSQIYSMTVFKNALQTYVSVEYKVSLGMMNKMRNL